MLVSYHEGYLYLLAICVLFCLLILGYNLVDRMTQGMRERKQYRRAQKIERMLSSYCTVAPEEQKKRKRYLDRHMSKPTGLLALLEALDALAWTDRECIPAQTRQLLCDVLLERFLTTYRRADPAIQGLLIKLLVRCDATSNRLKRQLLECLDNPQLLLRMEAFRGICANRDRNLVVQALHRLGEKKLPFSNKLITDTLMDFPGNRTLLAEALWQEFPGFSQEIQVPVLRLLTELNNPAYGRGMMALVKDEKADMEVRIAAIKYFAKVSVPQCVPVLVQCLQWDNWEFGAVAAKSLANYDCTGIFEELMKGITSKNWYVRNNCANAIVRACSPQQIQEALRTADRYGRDSIYYALDMKRQEEGMV